MTLMVALVVTMVLMIIIKVAMTDDSIGGDDYFNDCY